LKLSHNRHWLTRNGTEWRNRVQIGEVPLLGTELYHPLAWSDSPANDWFTAAYGTLQRRMLHRYDSNTGEELATWLLDTAQTGLDIGQPWGEFGELRLGWARQVLKARTELVSAAFGIGTAQGRWIEDGIRARAVVDQLDYAVFPQSGYRGELQLVAGRLSGDLSGHFTRIEAEGTAVRSWGRDTLSLHLQVLSAGVGAGAATAVQRYTLGGFQHLSGYQDGQLVGNQVLFGRLAWYRRLSGTPALTRGFFVGATAEAGNAWATGSQMRLSDLRSGFSLFLGADTGMGPLYLGVTHAPRGSTGLALFIGRP
jgi:NTE family protein